MTENLNGLIITVKILFLEIVNNYNISTISKSKILKSYQAKKTQKFANLILQLLKICFT
jgi:hypothetical protein